MRNKHIVIAGGTGFIGQAMATAWAKENKVTVLTRNIKGAANNAFGGSITADGVNYVQWDGKTTGEWVQAIDGCDLLINLAGRSVNCRYNDENKKEILHSRLDAVHVLGKAVNMIQQPPELMINVASATIYRHAEDRPQDEVTGEVGSGFSVDVCKAWEEAFYALTLPQTRKVILRMAIVLGRGGVLVPYSNLAKSGLGGHQGNGRQMFSWIHIDDVIAMTEWLYEHKEQHGTYNASAPQPVPNSAFMKMLRAHYEMPGLPAPKWLLEIAALLKGTETELLLKSRWVIPARLQQEGFIFRYPELKECLTDLLKYPL
jgi:uncharacterized protein (TIGR01777 family)